MKIDSARLTHPYVSVASSIAKLHALPLFTRIDPNNNRFLWEKAKLFTELAKKVSFPDNSSKQGKLFTESTYTLLF